MSTPATTSGAVPARAAGAAVNVGATERQISALAGAGLLVAGLSQRGVPGLVAGAAGAVLFARGASGRCAVYRALGVDTAASAAPAPGPIEIARAITIGFEPEAIRAALRDPKRWLEGGPIAAIEPSGDGWRMTVRALGYEIADIAIELRDEADGTVRVFARRGEDRPHEGRITLQPAPGGRDTEVRVSLCFHPSGRLSALLARGLEGAAERAAGHALQRLRQLLETGEIASVDPQPHGPRTVLTRALRAAASRRESAA